MSFLTVQEVFTPHTGFPMRTHYMINYKKTQLINSLPLLTTNNLH